MGTDENRLTFGLKIFILFHSHILPPTGLHINYRLKRYHLLAYYIILVNYSVKG